MLHCHCLPVFRGAVVAQRSCQSMSRPDIAERRPRTMAAGFLMAGSGHWRADRRDATCLRVAALPDHLHLRLFYPLQSATARISKSGCEYRKRVPQSGKLAQGYL